MILVRIRHGRCRAVLAEIRERPASWDGELMFPSCGRCARPRPERAQAVYAGRSWEEWDFVRQVAWADLRPHVEAALRSGRTVDVVA